MFLCRLLTISSNESYCINMSHLYLSLSSGLLIILHSLYYKPLIDQNGSTSINSIFTSLLLHSLTKILIMGLIKWHGKKQQTQQTRHKNLKKEIGFLKLVYTSLIKLWTYFNFIILVAVLQQISLSITIIASLIFVMFLLFAKINNRITRVMNRGKSLGENKFKIVSIIILIVISLILQPRSYFFSNQLHFQMFIIFTFSLLIFCYFYIHKLVFAITNRHTSVKTLFHQAVIESICVVFLIIYYTLTSQKGQNLSWEDQLKYLYEKLHIFILIVFLSVINQIVMGQFFKKISYFRCLVTNITGFLWSNIFTMAKSQINASQYISAMLMTIVLLIVIEVISQQNVKFLMQKFFKGRSKMKRDVLHEQSQINHDQIVNQ